MTLENRIQESVDAALAQMRTRVEADVRAMVEQIRSAAAAEREEAVGVARHEAEERAARETAREVADAEERVRASVDELVARARAEEREAAVAAARHTVEAEAAEQLEHAVGAARSEMQRALEDAQQHAAKAMEESVAAARASEREADMAGVVRLLESVRGLDGATTLSEVLDALAQAAAREAARAAVLVVRGDRLLGWKLAGFGIRDAQPKQIDLTLNEAGVLGLAVSSARVATTRDSLHTAAAPDFVQLPEDRMGLAVPVVVGGRVVGVLYADGFAADGRDVVVPSSWPEVIEILARHAARCLEALTVQKTAGTTAGPRFWVAPAGKSPTQAESPHAQEAGGVKMSGADMTPQPTIAEDAARRVARLLLSEIRLFHAPAVDEGRRSGKLLSRLEPQIEQARRLYNARVPDSLRTRAELFHQELVVTLAGGDRALLGSPA